MFHDFIQDELEVLDKACRAVSRHMQDTRNNGTSAIQRIVQPLGIRLTASVSEQNANIRQRIIPEMERWTVNDSIAFIYVRDDGTLLDIAAPTVTLLNSRNSVLNLSRDSCRYSTIAIYCTQDYWQICLLAGATSAIVAAIVPLFGSGCVCSALCPRCCCGYQRTL